MRGICSAEARAACPMMQGCVGSDAHHLFYPANQFKGRIEKPWRNLHFNVEQLPRCIHNAIHATGYIPEKPPREEMLQEIWNGDTGRAEDELNKQLFLGKLAMERDGDIA